jgi:hypothetical protein
MEKGWTHYTQIKISSQGGMMNHVFEFWQHKSNLKKTVIGLLFLFHLGDCLTTISITQTSSPITTEFDACIVISCENFENQCYIQTGAETIYMCAGPAPGWSKGSYEGGCSLCYAWSMIGWMATPGAYITENYEMTWGEYKWGKELKDKIQLKKAISLPIQPP